MLYFVAIGNSASIESKAPKTVVPAVRFRKEVIPGDQFIIEAKVDSWKRGVCKGSATGMTDGEIACEADMMITIPDILEQYELGYICRNGIFPFVVFYTAIYFNSDFSEFFWLWVIFNWIFSLMYLGYTYFYLNYKLDKIRAIN